MLSRTKDIYIAVREYVALNALLEISTTGDAELADSIGRVLEACLWFVGIFFGIQYRNGDDVVMGLRRYLDNSRLEEIWF